MAYVSKAARDAASKMTRTQVLRHIQTVEHCDEMEALRQMADAIGDGVLIARWDDQRSPPWAGPGGSPHTELHDYPLPDRGYWLGAKVDPGDGDRVYAVAPYDPLTKRQQRGGRFVFRRQFRKPLFIAVAVLNLWPVALPKVVKRDASPVAPIRRADGKPSGRKPIARQRVDNYIRKTFPNGDIGRTRLKEIARETNTSTSTVARVLGQKK